MRLLSAADVEANLLHPHRTVNSRPFEHDNRTSVDIAIDDRGALQLESFISDYRSLNETANHDLAGVDIDRRAARPGRWRNRRPR